MEKGRGGRFPAAMVLLDRRAGDFGELDQPPDSCGPHVLDRVPKPPAVAAKPAPGDGHFEDHDILNTSSMSLDNVQRCPRGFALRMSPDHLSLALAFAAEQAKASDAFQVFSAGLRGVAA